MGRIEELQNAKRVRNATVLEEVLTSDAHQIHETLADMKQEVFDLACDTICRGRDIYVIGVRNCAPLAELLAFYLNTIFEHVRLVHTNSASEIYEQMLHVNERDVVIGISFPRYSMRVLKALEFANSRSAKVIALTDTQHSPMNLYSSCNLLAKSELSTIVDSMVAPLSVINALVIALSLRKKQKVLDNLETLDRVWEDYPVDTHDEINQLDPDMQLIPRKGERQDA
ncbi:MAG: MurR/RpiR family transcriptional regulator [Lachnospiraceae bacterium]|nr:MurR/RpiR family transcriptional regulator [Lachnospiraceae bacterium]